MLKVVNSNLGRLPGRHSTPRRRMLGTRLERRRCHTGNHALSLALGSKRLSVLKSMVFAHRCSPTSDLLRHHHPTHHRRLPDDYAQLRSLPSNSATTTLESKDLAIRSSTFSIFRPAATTLVVGHYRSTTLSLAALSPAAAGSTPLPPKTKSSRKEPGTAWPRRPPSRRRMTSRRHDPPCAWRFQTLPRQANLPGDGDSVKPVGSPDPLSHHLRLGPAPLPPSRPIHPPPPLGARTSRAICSSTISAASRLLTPRPTAASSTAATTTLVVVHQQVNDTLTPCLSSAATVFTPRCSRGADRIEAYQHIISVEGILRVLHCNYSKGYSKNWLVFFNLMEEVKEREREEREKKEKEGGGGSRGGGPPRRCQRWRALRGRSLIQLAALLGRGARLCLVPRLRGRMPCGGWRGEG